MPTPTSELGKSVEYLQLEDVLQWDPGDEVTSIEVQAHVAQLQGA